MNNDFFCDEKCVVSFWIGETEHFLQHYQAMLRFLKLEEYKEHEFLVMSDAGLFPFMEDFLSYHIELPEWFTKLKLNKDCSEAVTPNSPVGSLTNPTIYSKLLNDFRQFYNRDKAVEIWPSRGATILHSNNAQQVFFAYPQFKKDKVVLDKPIITLFPEKKRNAESLNVPERVWEELLLELVKDYMVVVTGTEENSFLVNASGDGIINLIENISSIDRTKAVFKYLNSSILSISSQGGGTNLALVSEPKVPLYIIGHEKEKYTVTYNRFNRPTCFRYVSDYRVINTTTLLSDIKGFQERLLLADYKIEDSDSNEEFNSKEK